MATTRIHAAFVYARQVDGVSMVGFADAEYGTSQYVLLERGLRPDEQDLRLGLAGVHIEMDDQCKSGYDGVAGCELERDRVRIELNANGAKRLRCEPVLEITFRLRKKEWLALAEELRRLLGGWVPLRVKRSERGKQPPPLRG